MLGSTGRDPRQFPDPDRLDVTRTNARTHLALGTSIHLCLGAPLARLEATAMLSELTRRVERFERIGEPVRQPQRDDAQVRLAAGAVGAGRGVWPLMGPHDLGGDCHAWLLGEGRWGESNTGLVRGAEVSLLVDTHYDLPHTAEMLEGYAPLTAHHPIRTLVNTHSDGDHWHGNQLVAGPGVEIVASEAAAALMTPAAVSELAGLSDSSGPGRRVHPRSSRTTSICPASSPPRPPGPSPASWTSTSAARRCG